MLRTPLDSDPTTARILPLSAMQDGRLRVAYEYWLGRRDGRSMPSRRDLRPEDLPCCLGWINLVDVDHDPLRFCYRLVGSVIAECYGKDVTGLSVEDIAPASYAKVVRDHYTEAVLACEPLLHELQFPDEASSHPMMRLTLPLSDNDRDVNMLMTVSAFDHELYELRARQRAEGMLQ